MGVIIYLAIGFILNMPILFCYCWAAEWFEYSTWKGSTTQQAALNVLEDGFLFSDGPGIVFMLGICLVLCWAWPLTLAGLAVYTVVLWSIIKIKAWAKKK